MEHDHVYLQGKPAMTEHQKLKRRCPHCNKYLYHFAYKDGNNVICDCADCGHRWKARYLKKEWD